MAMVKRYIQTKIECVLKEIGVLCFLYDTGRGGYYFQLFCPVKKLMVWEHNLDASMEYASQNVAYHSFSCGQNKVKNFKSLKSRSNKV